METSLHRQLKEIYGIDPAAREVRLGTYRIDAIVDDTLIEVQVASLSAIRRKIAELVQRHRVLLVKPVVIRSYIVRKTSRLGTVLGARYSPTVHHPCEFFLDFVHFAKEFPRPNLSLEVLLIEQEEDRIPRRASRRGRSFRVTDRHLRSVLDRKLLTTAADLLQFLPLDLPSPFSTQDLAQRAAIPRWLAQKVTYSLRWSGAIHLAGKSRNAVLYEIPQARRRAA